MRREKNGTGLANADRNIADSRKGQVDDMRKVKKVVKAIGTMALACTLALTGVQVPGLDTQSGGKNIITAEAASTTDRLPLFCYMKNSSGVLYTYNYDNLTGQTGYIEPGDYCKILDVYSNGVVLVEYPTPRGKRQKYASASGFFVNVDFSNAVGYAGQQMTVYRRSSGNATLGKVFASDTVTIIGHANGRTQIFYKLSDGSGFKCGWVQGEYSIADGNDNSNNGQYSNGAQVSLKVPVYRQYDYPNTYIGTKTIKQIGCLVTSVAMVYSYKTGTTVRPDAMKGKLRFSNNDLYWSSLSSVGLALRGSYNCSINNSIMSTIYGRLKAGSPVIIGGRKSSGGTHWVVIKGYTGNSTTSFRSSDFQINDPNSSSRTTLGQFLGTYSKVIGLVY